MKFDYQEYLKAEAWKRFKVRSYPERVEPWFYYFAYGLVAAGLLLPILTGHPVICMILALVTIFSVYSLAYPLRCPECGSKVITRVVDDEDECYHFCHDCPKCEISWLTKKHRRSSS
jgi:hypothetical protein